MGMGRHQKSGVPARWVLVLCISSFLLGVLVINRLLATSETVDSNGRASSDQATSLHPLVDCQNKEGDILSRVSHTHDVIKTLDKTISSLEVELATARAAARSDGSPAVSKAVADQSKERPRMFFVMGIMTAFSSRKRRDSIRGTWLPKGDELKRLETEKGIIMRFVIGHSSSPGGVLDHTIEAEEEQHKDFFRLNHIEGYHELSSKTQIYFSSAVAKWDADFYIKVDDDVHVNLGMLGSTLARHRSKPRVYIGCMKSGPVLAQKGVKYHEPEYWKFGEEGNKYFRHATGQIYPLNQSKMISQESKLFNTMGSSSPLKRRNRTPSSVFSLFLIFLCLLDSSNAQSTPVFACDVAGNPSLAAYGFCNTAIKIEYRVADLVARLTLQEKIGVLTSKLHGVTRLGIPTYEWWSEALHGVSYVGPGTHFSGQVPGATSFPQVILTAASFNVSLFQAIGKVVSTEARAMYNVGLAGLTYWSPNVNIFRDPRWGRGQETPGEDPLLSSKYATGYVKGLQETDSSDANRLKVAACCKHYTAYDVDNWKGVERYSFNAVVNQQDLDDTYQPPFKSCVVDGNVASVMCSYNKVNGKPTCADPDLLSGVIRGEWKLNGYIVSDCDSVDVLYKNQHYTKTPEEAAAISINAGLDLNCGYFLGDHTEAAVKAGLVNEAAIDKAISNNFLTLMRLGFFDGDPKKQIYGGLGPKDVCTPANQELAAEAARQGIVLLKNTGSLPLSPNAIKTLAVIGPNANVTKTMIGNYEGTPCKYTTPLQGLAGTVHTTYLPGCSNVACSVVDVAGATKLAAEADAAVLVIGADQSIEAESRDRVDLNLPGQQQELVTQVAKAAKGPVFLVIMSGGGFDITFAKNDAKIAGILWVGYPGEAGGIAIADVIFGRYNPSGRLPMTWYPQSYVEKVPMTNMNMRPDKSNGYPGRTYRFYTGETVYAFGDGLSYTKFRHSLVKAPRLVSLSLEENHVCRSSECQSLDAIGPHCDNVVSGKGGTAFEVQIKVQNGGDREGIHTVFLFTTPPAVHGSPRKHLLGFEKIRLGKMEEAVVKFKVDVCKDLSVVDEVGKRKIGLGRHLLHVGDVKHSLSIRI